MRHHSLTLYFILILSPLHDHFQQPYIYYFIRLFNLFKIFILFFCTFIVVVVADDDVVENFNPSLGKFKRGRRHDVGCFLSEEKLIKKYFF